MTVRYPWPRYAAPLHCALTDVRLDDAPLTDDLVDAAHQRIHLERAPTWTQFRCRVTVSTDEPSPGGIDQPLHYVLVTSTATNTRMPFRLHGNGSSGDGEVVVRRADVDGAFALRAETGAVIAARRRVIGASDPWTVVLDHRHAPAPPGKPPFEIAWVNFRAPDAPPAAQAVPTAHALMIDAATEPRLLLNDGIEGLRGLLYNKYAQKERRRASDTLATSIVRHVVSTIFRAAVAEIRTYSGDGAQAEPTSALMRQTCEKIAAHMPGIGDVGELYEQVMGVADRPDDEAELWTRVEPTIDEVAGLTRALTTAAAEVAHG